MNMLKEQLKDLTVNVPKKIGGLEVTLYQSLPETLNVDQEEDLFAESNIAQISNGTYAFITEMREFKYYTSIIEAGNPDTIHTFLPENYWILDELEDNIVRFDELLQVALENPNEGYF